MRRFAASTNSYAADSSALIKTCARRRVVALPGHDARKIIVFFALCIFAVSAVHSAPLPTPAMVSQTSTAATKVKESKARKLPEQPPSPLPAAVPAKILQPAKRMIADAQNVFAAGDTERALRILGNASLKYPQEPEVFLEQARLLYALNETSKARRVLLSVRQKWPLYGPASALLGNVEWAAGNPLAAENAYRTAVRLDPRDALSHLRLARLANERGRHLDAFDEAARSLESDSSNAAAHILLADLLAGRGDTDAAMKHLEKAVKIAPDNPGLLLQYAILQRLAGKASAALESLKNARSLDPTDPAILEQFTLAYGARLDWINAREYGEEWTKLDGNNAAAWLARAWACLNTNELRDASSFLKKAIALDPQSASLHNGLGMVWLELRKVPEATAEFKKSIELDPQDITPRLNLGMLFISAEQWTEAIDWCRSTVTQFPSSPQAVAMLAYALAGSGDYAHAKLLASKALALNNDEVLARVTLSRALIADGKVQDGLAELTGASKASGLSSFVLTELAACYCAANDGPQAVRVVQQALQIAPSNLRAKAVMAEALKKLGNYQGAVLLLKECVVRNPKDLQLKVSLADAQQCSGDRDGAISTMEKAVKAHPDRAEAMAALAGYALEDKNYTEAESRARDALSHDAHCLPAQLVLADVLLLRGKLDSCAELCEKILQEAPASGRANMLAASCYYRLRKWKKACTCYENATACGVQLDCSNLAGFGRCLVESNEPHKAKQLLSKIPEESIPPACAKEIAVLKTLISRHLQPAR